MKATADAISNPATTKLTRMSLKSLTFVDTFEDPGTGTVDVGVKLVRLLLQFDEQFESPSDIILDLQINSQSWAIPSTFVLGIWCHCWTELSFRNFFIIESPASANLLALIMLSLYILYWKGLHFNDFVYSLIEITAINYSFFRLIAVPIHNYGGNLSKVENPEI